MSDALNLDALFMEIIGGHTPRPPTPQEAIRYFMRPRGRRQNLVFAFSPAPMGLSVYSAPND